MFDGQVYWPYSGSRVVRSEFFRSALRYCRDLNIGVIVGNTYKQSVFDFVQAYDPTCSATVFTPREFLAAEIGPQTILQSLNCDLRRALYLLAIAHHYNWPVVGITLLEAMAYELPTIASDWNGYRDLVVHGETGWLFPIRFTARPNIDPVETSFESWPITLHHIQDAITLDFHACEQFMRQCERDRDMARDMGRAGRLRVTQVFNWKCVMRRYQECWSTLLDMSYTDRAKADPSGVGLFPNFHAFFAGHDSSGCLGG